MIKLKKTLIIILDILIFLNIAFICGNSMMPVADSSALSHGFMDELLELFRLNYHDLPIEKEAFHGVVRKLAHMFEFFCLGALLCLRLGKNEAKIAATISFFLAVCVAILDEFIQSFSDRACRVSDMLIDSCGAAIGVAFALLIIYLINKKQTSI